MCIRNQIVLNAKGDRKGKIHLSEVSKKTICDLSIGQTWTNVSFNSSKDQKWCSLCFSMKPVNYKPLPVKRVNITNRKLKLTSDIQPVKIFHGAFV